MSASSLVEFSKQLKSIKYRNLPMVASRMAQTILEFPRRFSSRQLEGGIDISGEVFDTVWDETVGARIPKVQGITMSDSKWIIDMISSWSFHLVKFQSQYFGDSSTDTDEFILAKSELITEWNSVDTSKFGSTATYGTYDSLGFTLNQSELNDTTAFREFDVYSFARYVAQKDLVPQVAAIVITRGCCKWNDRHSEVAAIVDKLLDSYYLVCQLIEEMCFILEGTTPVMKSGSKSDIDYLAGNDPIKSIGNTFDPSDDWVSPEGMQPTGWLSAFTLSKGGKYRLVISTEEPYAVEFFKLDNEELDYSTINATDYDTSKIHRYLTDVFSCGNNAVVMFKVFDTSTNPLTDVFDPSKVTVHAYSLQSDNSQMDTTEEIDNPVVVGEGNWLEFYPISSSQIVTVVINSNVDIISDIQGDRYAEYGTGNEKISLAIATSANDRYDPNYRYHYTITRTERYASTTVPIRIQFESSFLSSDILIMQYTPDMSEVNAYPVDATGSIRNKYFPASEGWIDVTDTVRTKIIRALESYSDDDVVSNMTVNFDSTGESNPIMGNDLSGFFKLGMMSANPLGDAAFNSGTHLSISGSSISYDLEFPNGEVHDYDWGETNPPIQHSTGPNKCTMTHETSMWETTSAHVTILENSDDVENISSVNIKISACEDSDSGLVSSSVKKKSIIASFLRGTKFFYKKVSDNAVINSFSSGSSDYLVCNGMYNWAIPRKPNYSSDFFDNTAIPVRRWWNFNGSIVGANGNIIQITNALKVYLDEEIPNTSGRITFTKLALPAIKTSGGKDDPVVEPRLHFCRLSSDGESLEEISSVDLISDNAEVLTACPEVATGDSSIPKGNVTFIVDRPEGCDTIIAESVIYGEQIANAEFKKSGVGYYFSDSVDNGEYTGNGMCVLDVFPGKRKEIRSVTVRVSMHTEFKYIGYLFKLPSPGGIYLLEYYGSTTSTGYVPIYGISDPDLGESTKHFISVASRSPSVPPTYSTLITVNGKTFRMVSCMNSSALTNRKWMITPENRRCKIFDMSSDELGDVTHLLIVDPADKYNNIRWSISKLK